MKTLGMYLRISNDDDSIGESESIQNQRNLIYDYIKSKVEFKDWNILEFSDDGVSGTTFHRAGVQKMLRLCGKTINCVIVKDFSRFGRNLIEVGNYLDQIFPFLGVRFVSINDCFDSHDKNNKGKTIGLDMSLKAMVYEMYSRDLSQKISCVKNIQMLKGEFIGGGGSFYGYDKSPTNKNRIVIDEVAGLVVQRIFTLAARGIKPSKIAVRLNEEGVLPPLGYRNSNPNRTKHYVPNALDNNLWTQGTVRRIILDERYTGCFVGKKQKRIDISTNKKIAIPKEDWIRVENSHQPIVTKVLFEQAQTVIKENKSYKPRTKKELFVGFLKCQHCGRTLYRADCKNDYFYCKSRNHNPTGECTTIKIYKSDLIKVILSSICFEVEKIVKHDKDSTKIASLEEQITNSLKLLQDENARCRNNKLALYEQYNRGAISKDEFLQHKQYISNHVMENENKKNTMMEKLNNHNKEQFNSEHKDLGKYVFVTELTRPMLVELLREIKVYSDNRIDIVWNFKNSNEYSRLI